MTKSRFALYLVPPYPIARDIAEIHAMLEKQFGFKAAGRFQVHCTVKGFFKKKEGGLAPLIADLDNRLQHEKPITVEISGMISTGDILVLDLSRLGGIYNQPFADFRNRVVEVIRPFIAPDCDFVAEDLDPPFRGHFTLAFRDSPEKFHQEMLSWLAEAPIPTGAFTADTFHFLEFFAEDWEGPWWETLTWKLHQSWILKDKPT
jgi:2'-5' RNA ligase